MSITCQWLYNGLQKEKQRIILVDCRDYQEFEKDHIITSVCMPPELGLNEDGEEDFVDLTELDTSYFKHSTHFDHYNTREKKYLIVYNDNDHNMWIGHVISCMDVEGLVSNVQALEEGFQEFKSKYPFLITENPNPQSIYELSGYPYPTEIEYQSLYLSVTNESINDLHFENLGLDTVVYFGERPTINGNNDNVEFIPVEADNVLSEQFTNNFFTILSENNCKRILLHSCAGHQNVILMAILFLMNNKKKTLREAYHVVIQSFWKDGVALDSNVIKWLSAEENRILGSTSLSASEVDSGDVVEVTAAKFCCIS